MFQAIFETYSKNYLYFLWQFFGGAFFSLQCWQVGLRASQSLLPISRLFCLGISLLASAMKDITPTGRTGLECAFKTAQRPNSPVIWTWLLYLRTMAFFTYLAHQIYNWRLCGCACLCRAEPLLYVRSWLVVCSFPKQAVDSLFILDRIKNPSYREVTLGYICQYIISTCTMLAQLTCTPSSDLALIVVSFNCSSSWRGDSQSVLHVASGSIKGEEPLSY